MAGQCIQLPGRILARIRPRARFRDERRWRSRPLPGRRTIDGDGDFDNSRATWTRDRELPYVPTPIIDGDELYLWGDKGTIVCVEAKTGKDVWKARVEGDYSGSPIWLDGKLYCSARDGKVVVIAAGRKFELLAENQLGERSHATPAVAGGRMFLRGFEHLFCLRAKADR